MLNDLLDEIKCFKYQITIKILLKKYEGTEIEFSPVYFNSTTKAVINHTLHLEKAFEKARWTFRPLLGSSYKKLSL